MTTVTDFIDRALAAAGPAVVARLNRAISAFDAARLGDREGLRALSIAIAVIANRYHRARTTLYLDAARCWALELTSEGCSVPRRAPTHHLDSRLINETAGTLTKTVGALFAEVRSVPISGEHRMAIELAPIAQLLARYDADGVVAALESAKRYLADPTTAPSSQMLRQRLASSATRPTIVASAVQAA